MTNKTEFSKSLIHNAENIARQLLDYSLNALPFEVPQAVIDRNLKYQTEFVSFLGKAMEIETEEMVSKEFSEWHKIYVEEATFMLDKVSSLVAPYPAFRLFFQKKLMEIMEEMNLSIKECFFIIGRFNYVLDISLADSIIAYDRYNSDKHNRIKKELLELASPVVPLRNGVAVLPLIGSIDLDRTEHLLEYTVPKIGGMDVTTLILDCSGIYTVDTEVTTFVFRMNEVLKLLGIQMILTGLRPELAQKMVQIGTDFSSLITFSSVKTALDAWMS
ncbi:STAS domain-containing protein [Robertmurraya yapensis]|uniref:STAS domain-containing protein n=2 Tax=Bacillaceae TaxID=186817 RepID=A0A431WEI9_9BACI|nr:STAS domain-containing protein [Bacillus yapensis]RTR33964.1 STAS domain-containing protein [Bacillus yapensis]TKS97282.1 STAS domain-containing protein [Bacillus yapensis]